MSKQLTKATALAVQQAATDLTDAEIELRGAGLDLQGISRAAAADEPIDVGKHRDTNELKRKAAAYVRAVEAHATVIAKAAEELGS